MKEKQDGDLYEPLYRQIPITIDPKGKEVRIELKAPKRGEHLFVLMVVQGRQKGLSLPESVENYDILLRKQ